MRKQECIYWCMNFHTQKLSSVQPLGAALEYEFPYTKVILGVVALVHEFPYTKFILGAAPWCMNFLTQKLSLVRLPWCMNFHTQKRLHKSYLLVHMNATQIYHCVVVT